MDERINQIATLVKVSAYEAETSKKYIDGAPHIKHDSLRKLYGRLILYIFDSVTRHKKTPKVLDLGSGEGSVTLPFLQLGAKVVAVDISKKQLGLLKRKCGKFGNMLEVRCEDINEELKDKREQYDIIVFNSFLHHIPDYISMISEATSVLAKNGYIFSFQDPLRYDSVGKGAMKFSSASYFFWRVFKGDVIGGIKRRIRRSRGFYFKESVHDNTEYHVTRNGVDQEAILSFFKEKGFEYNMVTYFSTQSRLFQQIGATLKIKNTFAIVAKKPSVI